MLRSTRQPERKLVYHSSYLIQLLGLITIHFHCCQTHGFLEFPVHIRIRGSESEEYNEWQCFLLCSLAFFVDKSGLAFNALANKLFEYICQEFGFALLVI